MGSAFHNVSLKRRRDIKPSLNPVMAELCADSHPVSSKWLFGEDLSSAVREIFDHKKVQSQICRANNNNFSYRGRGRGLRGKPQFGASKFQFNFRNQGKFKGQFNPAKRGRGQPRGRGGAF